MPPRAAAAPGLAVPPGNGAGSGPAAEARLAAELAEERHVALELQRAILPLHDEAFDLPGLRTMVRYLPGVPGRPGRRRRPRLLPTARLRYRLSRRGDHDVPA